MTKRYSFKLALTAGLVVGVGITLIARDGIAADHIDAPASSADPAADITDFYAWHTDDGKVVAILDVAGFGEAGQAGTYDADVLYGIHIDNDGDNVADIDVWARFGQNDAGEWGVKIEGLPGGDAEVIGAVDENLDAGGGLMAFAGVADDPFFFDFEGFTETLQTAELKFDMSRDSFAGTNVTAIVVQMDADAAADGGTEFSIWSTTGRK